MCQYVHSHALKIDYRNKSFSIIELLSLLDLLRATLNKLY